MGDDLRKLRTYRDGIFADGVDACVQFKRRQFAVVEYRVLAKGGNTLWDDCGLAAEDKGVCCRLDDSVATLARIVSAVVFINSDTDEVGAVP